MSTKTTVRSDGEVSRRSRLRLEFFRQAWSSHKYAVPFELFYALVIGAGLMLYQNQLEVDRATREIALEKRLASRNEVIANVQFVRETVRDNPTGVKNFQGLNLRGADLSGLDLGCALDFSSSGVNLSNQADREVVRPIGPSLDASDRRQCSDFSGADLRDATLTGTDLTGSLFAGSDLSGVRAYAVTAPGMIVSSSRLRDARFTYSDLRGATFNSSPIEGRAAIRDLMTVGTQPHFTVVESYVSGLDVRGYRFDSSREMWTESSDMAVHVDRAAMGVFVRSLCPDKVSSDRFGHPCPRG